MSAFGPVAVLVLAAGASTRGSPLFVRAHSRACCRLRLPGQFTRVSNIQLNRTAYALRAPAAG